MGDYRTGTPVTAFLRAIRGASAFALVAFLAIGAGRAGAEGFPDGKYSFTSDASPNGTYERGYFTFNIDISIKNTDAAALFVTNCLAPITAEWYPRIAEAFGVPAGNAHQYKRTINITYVASGKPKTYESYTPGKPMQWFSGRITFPKSSLNSSLAYDCGSYIHEYVHSLQQSPAGCFGGGTNDALADWIRYCFYSGYSLDQLYAKGLSKKQWQSDAYKNCGFFEALRLRYIAEHPDDDEWAMMPKILYYMRTENAGKFCTETFGMSLDAFKEMWKNDAYLTGVEPPSVLSGADAVSMTHNHILDLGGVTKKFCGSLKGGGEPILIDGTIVTNGTMTVYPLESSYGWWTQRGARYTIAKNASFLVQKRSDQGGQMNLQGGAKLVIDGGYVEANNGRGANYGNYIGCDDGTTAQIDIRNGGQIKAPNSPMVIGLNADSTGILSVTNGAVRLSEQNLYIASDAASTGRVLMDGATLEAKYVCFGRNENGGLAQMSLRNTTANVDAFAMTKTPRSGSYLKLDGVVVMPGEEGVLFNGFTADCPVEIASGGVTVSNFYDTASTSVLAGSGAFTKRGPGMFTFNGASSFTGDIKLQEGTVKFDVAFTTAAGRKIVASHGTAVALTVNQAFNASTTNLVLSVGGGSASKVAIVVDELSHVAIGTEIPAFKSLASGTTLSQLAMPSGWEASQKSNGNIVLKRVQTQSGVNPPRAFADIYWCGAPGQFWNTDNAWRLLDESANYYLDGDRVHFETAGANSVVTVDSAPGGMYFAQSGTVQGSASLSVPSVDVAQSATATIDAPVVTDLTKTGEGTLELGSFTGGKALEVESGTVRLTSGSVVNPLSTAKNANYAKGVLDLGGASQTFYSSLDSSTDGLVRDGGEIRNGTFTVTPIGYLRMVDTTFTVGDGADLTISQTSGANGRLGLRGNAKLNIAGGSVTACNAGEYGYVGCDLASSGEIRITNGGSFRQTVSSMRVGWNGYSQVCSTGIVSVANGTFWLPATKELSLAGGLNSVAIVAITNGTLEAGKVQLCETEDGGLVELTLKNSTACLGGFEAANEPDENSRFVFDGATIVAQGQNGGFLGQVVPSVTIGTGGLVVTNESDIAIYAELLGSGALVKAGAGTLTLGSSRAAQTTIAEGSLVMAEGATLDGGKLTIGTDPARPAALDLGGQALTIYFTARSIVGTAAGGNVAIRNGDLTIPANFRVWNGSLTLGGGANVVVDASADRWVCVGGNDGSDESDTTKDALLVLDGATVTNDTGKHLGIGDFGTAPSKGTVVVKNGGSYVGRNNIYVAQGCEGHLVIDGTESSVTANKLFFCGEARDEAGENGYVVLTNGGVLAVSAVSYGNGAADGYFSFDGGVLRATAPGTLVDNKEKVNYNVGAQGGEIDNGGYDVTIARSLAGPGTLSFTGDGTTTLAAGVDVAGGVSVAGGTTLAVNGSSVGSLTLAGGSALSFANPSASSPTLSATSVSASAPVSISVTGVASGARYPLVSGVGSTPANAFSLASCPVSATLRVQDGTLWLYAGEGFVWTGEGSDNRMGNPENWLCGLAPTNGADLAISVQSAAAILCDIADFAPNSIAITEGSAAVSVSAADGCGLDGIGSVANRSGSEVTFDMPVRFAGNIDKSGSGIVRFAGGAYGAAPVNHSKFYGTYNLTAATWTLSSDVTLAANAVVNAGTTELNNNGKRLNAESGAVLNVAKMHPQAGGTVFGTFAGDVTTKTLYAEGSGAINLGQGFSGTLRTGHIQLHSGSSAKTFALKPSPDANLVVGGGDGITAHRGTVNLDGCVLRSSSDLVFKIIDNGYTGSAGIISVGSTGTQIDTSDFDNPSVGHTVTIRDSATKAHDLFVGAGSVTVFGCGKLRFQNSAKFTGGLVAQGGVTVALAANAQPGAGAVTMERGTTLEVPLSLDGKAVVAGEFFVAQSDGTKVNVRLGANSAAHVCGRAKVLTVRGGFADGVTAADFALANPTASGADASFEIIEGDSGDELWVDAGAGYVWTGAGANKLMSNTANWLGGVAPTEGGETVYFYTVSDVTVTSDIAGFAPAAVVFEAGSAKFTFNGSVPFSDVVSVFAGAGADATVNVPVYFAEAIDKSGDGIVRFNGGAYGTVPVNHSKFYGTYNLTAETWNVSSALTLATNAVVNAPATDLRETNASTEGVLCAEAGSRLVIAQLTHSTNKGDMFGKFAGEIEVGKVVLDYVNWYRINEDFTGRMKVGYVYFHSSNTDYMRFFSNGEFVVGRDGSDGSGFMARRGTFSLRETEADRPLVLRSAADWKFVSEKPGAGTGNGFCIASQGVEIDTTDWGDGATPRTVSVERSSSPAHVMTGPGYVSCFGNGKLWFKTSCEFTGGLTASNGVTLALSSGALPGAGDVAMAKGTTLEVPFAIDGGAIVAGAFNVADGAGDKVFVRIGALAGRAVCGSIKVLTVQGGFADGVTAADFALANPTASGAAATFRIVAGESGDELWLDAGAGYVWTGAGANKLMSNPANWLGGSVPNAGGETVYFHTESDVAVTSDIAGFAPAAVVFEAGSAKFTFNGPVPFSDVVSVSAGAGADATVNVPVDFAENIDKSGDGIVRFAGGANGGKPVNHSKFYGIYNVTGETWNVSSAITLAENAVVNAPDTTLTLDGSGLLGAEAGSRMCLRQISVTRGANTDFFNSGVGYLGELDVGSIWMKTTTLSKTYTFNAAFKGVFRVNSVKSSLAKGYFNFYPDPSAVVVIGDGDADGAASVSMGAGGQRFGNPGSPLVLRCGKDYSLFCGSKDGAYYPYGSTIRETSLDIDTTDCADGALGHTVTIYKNASNSSDTLLADNGGNTPSRVSCFGCGRLKFQNSAKFTGGLTASNGVTVVLCAGATPGNGPVTMARGTTLEVPFSTNGGAVVSGEFRIPVGDGKVSVRLGTDAGAVFCGKAKVLTVQGRFADGVEATDFALANKTVFGENGVGAMFEIISGDSGDELWVEAGTRDFVWGDGASGADWAAAGKWRVGGIAATWFNLADSTATFAADGDKATVNEPASAASVCFTANATILGSASLAVPSVGVASNVFAAISAPTAGSLVKTGAGALTLGSSRTEQTTLEEGTLVIGGEATVAPGKLAIGADPAKSVMFDYGGKTLPGGDPKGVLTAGCDITLTNGVFSFSTNPGYWDTTAPKSLTIAKDAEFVCAKRWVWNASSSAGRNDVTNYIYIAGGKMISTEKNNNWIMQNSRSGTLVVSVTDGGLFETAGKTYMLSCRDDTTDQDTPALLMSFRDSTLRVRNDSNLLLGHDDGGTSARKNPKAPVLEFAMTNSVLDVGTGTVFLGFNVQQSNTEGRSTADFENCVITAKQFCVYGDRPANAARFNGTRLVATAGAEYFLESQDDDTHKRVTAGPDGLFLDTHGFNVSLRADVRGEGPVVKEGSGILYVKVAQRGSGDFVCAGGETYLSDGLAMDRAVSVKGGARFTVNGAYMNGVASVALAEPGAELRIDNFKKGITPLAVGSLALPASGRGALTIYPAPDAETSHKILTITGNQTLADADLAKIVAPEGYTLSLADGGKSIVLKKGVAWPKAWNNGAPANDAMQSAFDDWATRNDWQAENAEAAFLLGLDVADYGDGLKVVSVARAGDKFAIGTEINLAKVNGRLYVKWAAAPDVPESGWTKAKATVGGGDAKTVIDIDASASARFFKLGIDYQIE